jgi:hypothetical protein
MIGWGQVLTCPQARPLARPEHGLVDPREPSRSGDLACVLPTAAASSRAEQKAGKIIGERANSASRKFWKLLRSMVTTSNGR